MIEHAIRLNTDKPHRCRNRQRSPKENKWIEEQIQIMLDNRVIEEADSPYSHNVIVVGKKDGEGEGNGPPMCQLRTTQQ